MSGRKGLVAVTALTVSTMLLGGGALSAFAAERGGRGHGDDRGATPQYQYVAPAATTANSEHETAKRDDDDRRGQTQQPAQSTEQPRQLPPGLSVTHPNNGLHIGEMREHEDEGLHNGDGFGNIVRHRDDDDDDLVTAPARVTETPRPCMADDDDHGCKLHHGDDDDQGEDADIDTD